MVVEFLLMPEKYCINNTYITEVLPLKAITPLPGVPEFVTGIMNVRGKIISVINLKRFFHLKEVGITEVNKIIVIKHNQMEFGIVTDAITGTGSIALEELSAPPVTIHGIGAEYIKGITREGLIVLDIVTILTSKSLIIDQK